MQGSTIPILSTPWSPNLQHARWRYAAFFSAYLYQGLVAGFSLTALANTYAGRGADASEVGLHAAIIGLPWTIQPLLWGPLVDRAGKGHRRAWGVAALVAGQVSLSGLLFVPGIEAITAIGIVFFLHSVSASLLDTVSDRLIMDHVPPTELGRMSACTRIGFVAGTSLSGVVFAWTLATWTFRESIVLLLGLSCLATLLPMLVREAPNQAFLQIPKATRATTGRVSPSFGRFLKRLSIGFRRPAAIRLLLLCFALDFAFSLFEVGLTVDLIRERGWDALDLSRHQATLTVISGTAGALAIGFWSDRAGALPALRLLLGLVAAAFALAVALIAAGIPGVVGGVLLGLAAVSPSLVIVALVPALMQASGRRVGAATEFETYMAVMNLGSVAGAALSGPFQTVAPLTVAAILIALVSFSGTWLAGRPEKILRKRATGRSAT